MPRRSIAGAAFKVSERCANPCSAAQLLAIAATSLRAFYANIAEINHFFTKAMLYMHCCDAAFLLQRVTTVTIYSPYDTALLMEGIMHEVGKSRRRGFFEALGRAYGASIEYERLSAMSDRALAARNLTRAQIPQYILSRL
jgi:hypothetical protein